MLPLAAERVLGLLMNQPGFLWAVPVDPGDYISSQKSCIIVWLSGVPCYMVY